VKAGALSPGARRAVSVKEHPFLFTGGRDRRRLI
jgi:hypothetical protein